jgi:hypothetical protein
MGTCDVLRCASRAIQVMTMAPPGAARLQARLCDRHYDAIEKGDRWLAEWTRGLDEVTVALAMDGDLPPLVRNYTCTSGHLSDRGETEVLDLELMHSDGSTTRVEFELDPDASRSLGMWLRGRSPSPPKAG